MINIFALLLTFFYFGQQPGLASSHFQEVTRYKLGGDGGWDCVVADSDSHRLFIARSNRLMVVDTQTGKLIDEIKGTEGIHGIALAPDLGLGFTSNGKTSTVTPFDLKTLKVQDQIPVGGENPDGILYEPVHKQVYVFNGKSHDVSVIDGKTKKVTGHISLGGKPEFAATDGQGLVYINIEDKNKLDVIDSKTQKITKTFSLGTCDEPSGLAMDPKTRRLFVGCGNKTNVILTADTGKVLKTFPVGDGVDGVAFDPKTNLEFVSAGEGNLSVVHEVSADQFEFIEKVPTQKGARTLAVDSETGNVFVVTSLFGPSPSPEPGHKSRPYVLPDSFVVIVVNKSQ